MMCIYEVMDFINKGNKNTKIIDDIYIITAFRFPFEMKYFMSGTALYPNTKNRIEENPTVCDMDEMCGDKRAHIAVVSK